MGTAKIRITDHYFKNIEEKKNEVSITISGQEHFNMKHLNFIEKYFLLIVFKNKLWKKNHF